MELVDILSLVKAGYTREEIEKMETPETTAQTLQGTEPVQKEAPVAEPAPVAQPAPQPAQQEAQPTMAELMQSIAKLTSAVQANAIAQSVIPGAANSQTPTAESMLAEIIRPTFKARE